MSTSTKIWPAETGGLRAETGGVPAGTPSVRQGYDGPASGDPPAVWVRGICPDCGGPVVSNAYYVGSGQYLTVWQCWHSLKAQPGCDYRKVLK